MSTSYLWRKPLIVNAYLFRIPRLTFTIVVTIVIQNAFNPTFKNHSFLSSLQSFFISEFRDAASMDLTCSLLSHTTSYYNVNSQGQIGTDDKQMAVIQILAQNISNMLPFSHLGLSSTSDLPFHIQLTNIPLTSLITRL